MTENEKLKKAKALIANKGGCTGNIVPCSKCPFYCHSDPYIDPCINAFKLAERYLLDLEVRNIIES